MSFLFAGKLQINKKQGKQLLEKLKLKIIKLDLSVCQISISHT